MKRKTKTFTTGTEKCQREVHLIWIKLRVKKKIATLRFFFLNHGPTPLECLRFKLYYMTDTEVCKKSARPFFYTGNKYPGSLGEENTKLHWRKHPNIKHKRFSSPLKVSLKLKITKHIFLKNQPSVRESTYNKSFIKLIRISDNWSILWIL